MKRAHLLAAAAVLLAACGDGSSSSDPSETSPSTPRTYDFSAFEQEVEAFLAETPRVDGVGAIIVHRDEGVIFERGFGAYPTDRISLVASSSKMITAGVLLRLQDEGLLDMNEPIVDAVGDWGTNNPEVTPAQLVSNSSGLVGLLPNPTYAPYLCQYVYTGRLQDCGRIIFTGSQDDPDVIPPDTQFRYGGAQWQIAGALAEIVSGKSWAELVDETYVGPCELEVLGYNNHFVQLLAGDGNFFGYPAGFDGDPGNLRPTENPNLEGGAYVSIGDYGKLLLMHLRGGMCGENRVLSEDAIRQSHADRIGPAFGGSTGNPNFPGYGLGWWVDRESGVIQDPGAYGSTAFLDEKRGYGVFLVIEASADLGAILAQRTRDPIRDAIEAAN